MIGEGAVAAVDGDGPGRRHGRGAAGGDDDSGLDTVGKVVTVDDAVVLNAATDEPRARADEHAGSEPAARGYACRPSAEGVVDRRTTLAVSVKGLLAAAIAAMETRLAKDVRATMLSV